MDLGLEDKVAVVTGSSTGIGRAIALALAGEGCCVVINGRKEKRLKATAQELMQAGGVIHAVVADLCEPEAAKLLVAETVERFGAVHILVNNVGGVTRVAGFEELTDEEWVAAFNSNVLAAVRMTRAVLPHMKTQSWGRIINISSESGVQPDASIPHYNAAKAALNSLTKSLSKAYGKDGILINTVSPAFVRTPMIDAILLMQARARGISVIDAEQAILRESRPNIVLNRAARVEEVAGICVFLASEQASFMTGANHRVDGGSVAGL